MLIKPGKTCSNEKNQTIPICNFFYKPFIILTKRGYLIKNLETYSDSHPVNEPDDSKNKVTQRVAFTSTFPKPKGPRIIFKKTKSSAELTKLNQDYNPSSLSILKRERLSLTWSN